MNPLPPVLDRTIDTPAEAVPGAERFAHVVRLARHLFDVPMVAVNLVDAEVQSSLACSGFPGDDVPRRDSFCAHAVDTDAALVVPDLAADRRFAANPFVGADPGIRFYAGEPLHAQDGSAVGTLCLLDSRPRDLDPQQARMLRDLANWVERELVHDAEAEQARRIQARLLPARPLLVDGYDLAGGCRPAREVGGDYFDWLALPDGTVQVCLADVMGKGVEGAVVASGVRAILRGASRFIPLERILGRIESFLADDDTGAVTFVTMFGARLTPATGEIEYIDAGHGLALVVAPDGSSRRLAAVHPPVGVVPGTEWRVAHDRLAPGETLLVVSDGVLDVFPDTPSAFRAGVELVAGARRVQDVVDAVTASGGEHPLDDVTALALRRAS
ncbi:PP2C family protein-serine/threonine phosphatase [Phycicoccus flavus]|uniref:PP2C family protein-serine/threonine phosphatase n=1 Tax=Phycicoccus flavus TaxID=2502783 RepID=UPI000FEB8E5B|nr:SpoIIE family protein phosphatase [Phycicoccus flavus]NHA68153.1 SpoIIE family protein phosphatase [Phycicoccus flavus]